MSLIYKTICFSAKRRLDGYNESPQRFQSIIAICKLDPEYVAVHKCTPYTIYIENIKDNLDLWDSYNSMDDLLVDWIEGTTESNPRNIGTQSILKFEVCRTKSDQLKYYNIYSRELLNLNKFTKSFAIAEPLIKDKHEKKFNVVYTNDDKGKVHKRSITAKTSSEAVMKTKKSLANIKIQRSSDKKPLYVKSIKAFETPDQDRVMESYMNAQQSKFQKQTQ